MKRRPIEKGGVSVLPQVILERGREQPLPDQLVEELRRLIHAGALPPGSRLPATRTAARELGVSRTVVVDAYEQLQMEGYLEARVGAGTKVSPTLPCHLLQPRDVEPVEDEGKAPVRLSRRGERLAAEWKESRFVAGHGPFRPGGVDAENFPNRLWSRLTARVWRDRPEELVAYGDPLGHEPLRSAIAEHLVRYRAVRCQPEQIMITAGSQQAVDLMARLLIDVGEGVAVEDPCYAGAKAALSGAGARLVPVPVDGDGLNLRAAGPELETAPLVYCTPSHQYPLGVTMSLERRIRLLEWARRRGAWVIEDDYDSEFRYQGRPLPSLQGLDAAGHVLYVGTFSKVLAPGLRVGFAVLPEGLVEPACRARLVMDRHVTLSVQAVLAEFMADGHLERHIARLRSVYDARRKALVESIEELLGGQATVVPGPAGLHLTVLLRPRISDVAVAERALGRGIQAPPLSTHFIGKPAWQGLVLGFAGATPEELRVGVEVLRDAIEDVGREAAGDGDEWWEDGRRIS